MALHSDLEIRWKNYRASEDTKWVKIPALTVLIGPNNSGKTSVISPLLLLNQTMASRDAMTPLVTRGRLVDAGPFKNIVHNHDTFRHLFFGLRYHTHEVKGKIGKIGDYPPGAAEITLVAGKQPEDIVLQRYALFDILQRPFLSQTRNNSGTYTLKSESLKLTKSRERTVIRQAKPINFLFSPSTALRALQAPPKNRGEKISLVEPSRGFLTYVSALNAAFGDLGDLFRNVSYVGPLREPPRRYYPIASEMPISVGSRGEHMANLVRRRLPDLRGRLDSWIKRFEFGKRLVVQYLSNELFSLSFENDSRPSQTNIADAGFGASQVLPLIVQALAAAPQSLTIAEQPEIHLNPRLQYLLADLFVEMANSDHRVIVETHSEHLLLRLRRLVASGKIERSKVAIYFVEKKDGISSIRHIPLEKNGHIEAEIWPKGFFEDSLRESLALAAAQWPRSAKRQRR
jgi:predicted ATPase